MVYPNNFEEKIEFNFIRNKLISLCSNDIARKHVEDLSFSSDYSVIKRNLQQTNEMKNILLFKSNLPLQDYFDMSRDLIKITAKGSYLESDSLQKLHLSLNTIIEIIIFINSLENEKFVELKKIIPTLTDNAFEIVEKIKSIIDAKGGIVDTASDKLNNIRKQINKLSSSLDKISKKQLQYCRDEGIIDRDTELTIRNGRMVIPVPAANKRRIRGFIHDSSATGQTIYIEPAESFEANNEIQNLQIDERQEIIRILVFVSDLLRPNIEWLLNYYKFLGTIDFIIAKAKLSIEIGGLMPTLSTIPVIEWFGAFHPILKERLNAQKKTIVAQNITLNSEKRILIISGPNAGGKSVSLKTIALLQYMLQCGLLIPVKEVSKCGVFSKIFIEIGDQQSLENDLSTYSSHLININNLLNIANETTLFLLDEFGAGTEPQIGGAIAEAVLEYLLLTNCLGVVTTHYTNLKLMASRHTSIVNAAMLYDTKEMLPLYKLHIGKPGSSFALEIAQKTGINFKILNEAKRKIGQKQLNFEIQLNELEVEKEKISKKQKELDKADEALAEITNKYYKLLEELEAKKAQFIKEAKNQAKDILSKSNQIIEATVKEIKEKKAERDATLKARKKLYEQKAELLKDKEKNSRSNNDLNNDFSTLEDKRIFEINNLVKIKGQNKIGVIKDIKSGKVWIEFDIITVKTALDNIIFATKDEIKEFNKALNANTNRQQNNYFNSLQEAVAEFKLTIDVRGQKTDEAFFNIQQYIDKASLLRIPIVKILHGKGSGSLRQMIHEMLKTSTEVESFIDENEEKGGKGITIVNIN